MTDARKLAAPDQEKLRKRAVRLHKQGLTNRAIAQKLGVHAGTVCRWIKLYEQEGTDAIKARTRGPGRRLKRELTVTQEGKMLDRMIAHTPDQLDLTGSLWTRWCVQKLIMRETDVNLPIRTLGEYFTRWGVNPRHPPIRHRTPLPESTAAWLQRTYPMIAQQAAQERAEIHWFDVAVPLTSQEWLFSGQRGKPYEELKSRLVGIHLLSATNNQGKASFKLSAEFDEEAFIDFLARLLASTSRKILLLIEKSTKASALEVDDWLAGQQGRIEVLRYG